MRLTYAFVGISIALVGLGCSDSETGDTSGTATSGTGGSSTSSSSSTTSSTSSSSSSSASSTGAGAAGGGGSGAAGGQGGNGGQGGAGGSGGQGGAGGSGPVAVHLDLTTDPNGLLWYAADSALYLTDDIANQLLKWTDANGFEVLATLPAPPAMGAGLGQLVKLSDGRFVIPRFGFGSAGDVVIVNPDFTTAIVPNLDVTRRRMGLTLAAGDTLYVSSFVKVGMSKVGYVSQLDITAGAETDLAVAGLQKPVGVLDIGTDLYVSDQDQTKMVKFPIASPATATDFATLASADFVSEGPNGSIFTGGTLGEVYQIDTAGMSTVFAGGMDQVHGTAYDAAGKRLFVVDHDSDPSNGLVHKLHILPVP